MVENAGLCLAKSGVEDQSTDKTWELEGTWNAFNSKTDKN